MKTKITLGIIALACTQAMAGDIQTSIFTTDLSSEAKNLNLSGSCDSANCNVPSMTPPIMTGTGSSTVLSQATLANQTQTINCQSAGYDATHSGSVNQSRNVYIQNGQIVPGTESAWTTSVDTCQQTLSETQTIACPAPQTGTITQARSYFAKSGVKIAGSESVWSDISNTCITPVVKPFGGNIYFANVGINSWLLYGGNKSGNGGGLDYKRLSNRIWEDGSSVAFGTYVTMIGTPNYNAFCSSQGKTYVQNANPPAAIKSQLDNHINSWISSVDKSMWNTNYFPVRYYSACQ